MSYKLVYKDNGFIIAFFGDISIKELNKGNGDIHGHYEFDTHRYQIVDLREANLSDVSMEDTLEPAAMDVVASATNTSVRIALVASDTHSFNICKEFADHSKEMGSPWGYGVFYDYNEALEWAKTEQWAARVSSPVTPGVGTQ